MKGTELQACILACLVILFHRPGRLEAQMLAGQVLDQTSGTPAALVRVTLAGLDGLPVVFTLSDAQGYFAVTAPEAGEYWVNAESGFYWNYTDGPVPLTLGDTLMVEFALIPRPMELDEIVVRGEPRPWRMVLGGYCEREKSGLGWHLDREKIERHAFRQISDVLFTVPGVHLINSKFGSREPVFGRAGFWRSLTQAGPPPACFPKVFLDGMLFSPGGDVPTDIDLLLHPDEVEAIEVFSSPMEVPARFGGLSGAQCGVIGIWSR